MNHHKLQVPLIQEVQLTLLGKSSESSFFFFFFGGGGGGCPL